MIIEKIASTKLNPAPYNPRKDLKPGDPEYEKLRRSIGEFGYVEPIVWNKQTGNIVGGHQRFKVLRDLGYTDVDCVVVDIDEVQEKALNVAMNKISGAWNESKLTDLLGELDAADFDVSLTGFDAADLEALFNDKAAGGVNEDGFDVDKAAAEIETPVSRRGDVWLLGKHRLMCGDSTSAEDVAQLMGGVKADMVFTDPPYGVSIGDKNKMLNSVQWSGRCLENIENDTLKPDELHEVLKNAFQQVKASLNDCAAVYVTAPQGGSLGMVMLQMMRDAGLEVRHTLIWVKNSATFSMGRLDYDYQHEPILFTWNKTHKKIMAGTHKTSCWFIDKPLKSKLHPTMKPIELIANALLNSSERGDVVLDAFGGSGSTLIACEQLDRQCYMMELDPKYCDVIALRFAEMKQNDGADIVCERDGQTLRYADM